MADKFVRVPVDMLEALAHGFTDMDHTTQTLFCAHCGADLDEKEPHKPDCMMVRAKAILAADPQEPEKAEQPQAQDELDLFKEWLATHDPRGFKPAAYDDQTYKWKAWQARAALSQDKQESVEYNGEGWELLAMALAEEDHDDIHELIYDGGPIPEPWGEVWQKYEGDAKRMIELVQKHVPLYAAPAPHAQDSQQSAWNAAIEAAIKRIDEIDDGNAPEYRACQEAIRALRQQAAPAQADDKKTFNPRELVTLNGKQLKALLDFTWPDQDDADQADCETTLIAHDTPFKSTEGDDMPAGIYFYCTEYPEEGIVHLDDDAESQPSSKVEVDL